MKTLITQPNYIPWRGYFYAINLADVFVVYDEVQYTRRDWRNRNVIKTAKGLQWLTIPVSVKGKYHQRINETIISDQRWAIKHWKAIRLNYSRTPFFQKYAPELENLYLSLQTELFLSNVNLAFIHTLCKLLNIQTRIVNSSDFGFSGEKSEKLLSICQQLNTTQYLSGKAALPYLDVFLFAQNQIEVVWLDYDHFTSYPQLFPPFEPHVSVLDLLFNTGPEAKNYLLPQNSF